MRWDKLFLQGTVFLLWIALFPCNAFSQGKGYGVEVKAIPPLSINVIPGRILSISFVVTNTGDKTQEFSEEVILPEGWMAIIPEETFTLAPRESTTRLVAVQAPLKAFRGTFSLTYLVRSRKNPSIRDEEKINLSVPAIYRLQFIIEDKPLVAIAGETFKIRMRLFNLGNTTRRVRFELDPGADAKASIEPKEATIPPGEGHPLVITVTTSPLIASRFYFLNVKAISTDGEEGQQVTTLNVEQDIILHSSISLDPYMVIPTELSLELLGENNSGENNDEWNRGQSFQWSGDGDLDEEGRQHVDFSFRGPDTSDKGSFGDTDEYYFNFTGPNYDVNLGDEGFPLSPLTSSSRYGRGIGVTYHPETSRWSIGGQHIFSRWGPPDWNQTGFFIGNKITDRLEVRLHYYEYSQDPYSREASFRDTLWSVETQYDPSEKLSIDSEYGWGDTTRQDSQDDDQAYRIVARGTDGSRTNWSLMRIHAGNDFWGSYHSYDYSEETIGFPLAERLSGNVTYSVYEENLGLYDEYGRSDAPRETLFRASLSYDLLNGWFIDIGHDDFTRTDRFTPEDYDFSETAFWTRVGRSLEKISYSLEVREAKQTNRLLNHDDTVWNYNFFLSYQFAPTLLITAFANLGDDEALTDSRLMSRSSSTGLTINWTASPNFSLYAWYTRNSFNTRDTTENEQYNIKSIYTLPNKHRIELELRHEHFFSGEEDEDSYRLSYIIPIDIHGEKRKQVGAFTGRVFDATRPDHPPLERVILFVGDQSAVTDSKGIFNFPALKPGTQTLLIDPNSIPAGKIPDLKSQATIEIRGGGTASLDIGILEGARVTGKVTLEAKLPEEGPNKKTVDLLEKTIPQSGGLGHILVELSNGDETIRRLTDNWGTFLFEGIRPGTWHLRIYDFNLPPGYYLEKSGAELILSPGKTEEFSCRVLPKQRSIQFIEEGHVGTQKKK